MNFEDFKDRINDLFQGLKNQVLESEAYNTLHEKYVTLPTSTQKLISLSGLAAIAVTLFLIPLTFFLSSGDHVNSFETQRKLIRDLFKASRIASTTSTSGSIKGSLLSSRVQGIVSSLKLTEEQNGSVKPMSPEDLNSSPSAKGIEKEGVQVTLKKLNLRQVLDASFRMQTLHPSLKLIGITVDADTEDDHYFNTTFKLVSYFQSIQEEPKAVEEAENKKQPTRKRRKPRTRGK